MRLRSHKQKTNFSKGTLIRKENINKKACLKLGTHVKPVRLPGKKKFFIISIYLQHAVWLRAYNREMSRYYGAYEI